MLEPPLETVAPPDDEPVPPVGPAGGDDEHPNEISGMTERSQGQAGDPEALGRNIVKQQ